MSNALLSLLWPVNCDPFGKRLSPSTKLVLMLIADKIGEQSSYCTWHQDRIISAACLTERQFRRVRDALKKWGWLTWERTRPQRYSSYNFKWALNADVIRQSSAEQGNVVRTPTSEQGNVVRTPTSEQGNVVRTPTSDRFGHPRPIGSDTHVRTVRTPTSESLTILPSSETSNRNQYMKPPSNTTLSSKTAETRESVACACTTKNQFGFAWKTWPHKPQERYDAKKEAHAWREWQKINPSPDLIKHIMAAIDRYADQNAHRDPRYNQGFDYWLRGEGWNDEETYVDSTGESRPSQPGKRERDLEDDPNELDSDELTPEQVAANRRAIAEACKPKRKPVRAVNHAR